MIKSKSDKIIRSFAKRKHLVKVDNTHLDEANPVKGFLFLPDAKDSEMVSGFIEGHDVSLVHRTVHLPHSDKKISRYVLELLREQVSEHVIALSSTHSEDDIKFLLAGFHHYAKADVPGWRIFTNAKHIHLASQVQPFLAQISQYSVNDVEFDGSYLRLYLEEIDSEGEIDNLLSYMRLIDQI